MCNSMTNNTIAIQVIQTRCMNKTKLQCKILNEAIGVSLHSVATHVFKMSL